MATISESLRTFLLSIPELTAITTVVAEGGVPTEDEPPYVWFQRDGEEIPIDLDGTPGTTNTQYSIECVSRDLAEADAMADIVRANLNGFRGDFATLFAKYSQVDGKSDDYIVRNPTDNGESVSALNLTMQF